MKYPPKKITQKTAQRLEGWKTPEWVVRALVAHELLDIDVQILDPCCGLGTIGDTIETMMPNTNVIRSDIKQWTNDPRVVQHDFLSHKVHPKIPRDIEFYVVMNPPFTKTQDFINRAFELSAKAVYCFQKTSFFTALSRRDWHAVQPLRHIYQCGERATCIRFDKVDDFKSNGKENYSWFVYDKNHPPEHDPRISLIYKL